MDKGQGQWGREEDRIGELRLSGGKDKRQGQWERPDDKQARSLSLITRQSCAVLV